MSYVNKRTRIFLEKDAGDTELCTKRSEGRMKTYISAYDARCWSPILEENRQYILELILKTCKESKVARIIPLEALIKLLMKEKNAIIQQLREQVAEYEKFMAGLKLTPEQQGQLATIQETTSRIGPKESISELEIAATDIAAAETTSAVKSFVSGGKSAIRSSLAARSGVSVGAKSAGSVAAKSAGSVAGKSVGSVASGSVGSAAGKSVASGAAKSAVSAAGKSVASGAAKSAVSAAGKSAVSAAGKSAVSAAGKSAGAATARSSGLADAKSVQSAGVRSTGSVAGKSTGSAAAKSTGAAAATSAGSEPARGAVSSQRGSTAAAPSVKGIASSVKGTIPSVKGSATGPTGGPPEEITGFPDSISATIEGPIEEEPFEVEPTEEASVDTKAAGDINTIIKERDELNQQYEDCKEELQRLKNRLGDADLIKLSEENCFLKCKIKEKERECAALRIKADEVNCLRVEINCLKCYLDDLKHIRDKYEALLRKTKDYDDIKKAYNELMAREQERCKECGKLRQQADRAASLECERNCLVQEVDDCHCIIANKDDEIVRLLNHVDIISQERDDQSARLQQHSGSIQSNPEKKDCMTAESQEKLQNVQEDLKRTIECVSCEANCLKQYIAKLERELLCMQQQILESDAEKEELRKVVQKLQVAARGDEHSRRLVRLARCAVEGVTEALQRHKIINLKNPPKANGSDSISEENQMPEEVEETVKETVEETVEETAEETVEEKAD